MELLTLSVGLQMEHLFRADSLKWCVMQYTGHHAHVTTTEWVLMGEAN